MFEKFKTQVEPRAAGEWFHFKVTWKIAVNLFFTISLLSDNFYIHQRLDNACEKEKNKLRRHHIIFMVCSAGSRPWDGGWGRSSRPIDKGEGRSPQKNFSALRASVWSKNNGGPGPRAPPRDPLLVCTLIEHSAREIARSYWKKWVEYGKEGLVSNKRLARYEEGFEPIRNGEIFWMTNKYMSCDLEVTNENSCLEGKFHQYSISSQVWRQNSKVSSWPHFLHHLDSAGSRYYGDLHGSYHISFDSFESGNGTR